MVDVGVDELIGGALTEPHEHSCLLLLLAVSEVNEMPFVVSILMSDILDDIRVAIAVHVCVCVGREVKDTAFCSTDPGSERAVSQSLVVQVKALGEDRHSEHHVPWLLLLRLLPPEPPGE